jgi:transposase-like protein
MTANLHLPVFTDETQAREWLEARIWANGRFCPHCGNVEQERISALHGKKHRVGLYQCNACREQFTITVGTVFERSKIPLTKWLAALFLMSASKKGMSTHQMHRMLGVSVKSTWFMMHRLREAMRSGSLAPMGGAGSIVEIDETYIGKKAGSEKRRGTAHKNIVLTLVERGGSARSFHVEGTKKSDVLPIIRANIAAETHVMTDESNTYKELGNEFAKHDAVDHSREEYSYTDRLTGVQIGTTRSKASIQFSSEE